MKGTYKKPNEDSSGTSNGQDGDLSFDLSKIPEEHREWASNRIKEGATAEEIALSFISQGFDNEKKISGQGAELGDLRKEVAGIVKSLEGKDGEPSGEPEPKPKPKPDEEISGEEIKELADLVKSAKEYKKIVPEVKQLKQTVDSLKAETSREVERKAVDKFLRSAKELEILLGPELAGKYLNRKELKKSPIFKYLDPDAIHDGVKNPYAQGFWADDSPCIAVWRKIAPDSELAAILAKGKSLSERGVKSGLPKAKDASNVGEGIKAFLTGFAEKSATSGTFKK